MAESKIVLGVDYGDARTGLAVSDPSGLMAFGAGCIRAEGMKKAAAGVAQAAVDRHASLIVVGNPINMNGSFGLRIGYEGAIYSGQKRKNVVDELSAQLILQDYLDSRKNRNL